MPTNQENIAYYQCRIAACAEQIARAACPSTNRVHEDFARLYRERLDTLVCERPLDGKPGAEGAAPGADGSDIAGPADSGSHFV